MEWLGLYTNENQFHFRLLILKRYQQGCIAILFTFIVYHIGLWLEFGLLLRMLMRKWPLFIIQVHKLPIYDFFDIGLNARTKQT